MRILVVANGYPPRGRFGTEFYARSLVRALTARGHEVEVLHPVRDGRRPRYTLETVREEGIPVHLLANPGDPHRRFSPSYSDPAVEAVFDRLLAERGFDLVHCVYLLWGLSVGLPAVARARGVPSVVTVTDHGLVCHRGQMFDHRLRPCGGPHPPAVCARCIRTPAPFDAPLPVRVAKRVAAAALAGAGGLGRVATARDLERRERAVAAALDAARVVIAPTAPIGAALLEKGLDPGKLVELVYAFDEGPYAAVRDAAPPARARVGFLGQLAPHKGLGTLVAAARLVARERGADALELVLHGAPGPGRHRLYAEHVLADVRPARVVRGAPFEPDEAPRVLAGFSALAVPSEWDENAPLALLQARAAGVPVLGSDVGGIRSVLDVPDQGRLVPPGDVGAWARALAAVADGEVARPRRPGLPLSLDEHVDRLEELYADARAGARGTTEPARSLSVGLLSQGWFPDAGGVETHARDLARELRAAGHRVHVLCLDYGPDREPYSYRDEEVEGVRVRRMAYLYQDHRALADLVRNPRAGDVLREWVEESGVDLVHVQHPTGWGTGALELLYELGRPCVATLHDYWPLCPRGQMLRPDGGVCARPEAGICAACLAATWPHLMPSGGGEPRGPRGVPVADDLTAAAARTAYALDCLALPERLVTPSAAARAVYARAGVLPERITVVENGVDVEGLVAAVARLRREAPRRDDGLRFGILGTVLPSKGVLELARAFVAAGIEGATLAVHGALPAYHGDPRYVDELRRLAADAEAVHVHGPYTLDELPAILAGLDVVVAASRWEEVYGLTVREAAAVGLPVVVSDAGDLPSVTRGGTAGLVVPRDDREAWVRALRLVASDPERRRAWSAAPRRVHDAGAMAAELVAIYRDAIARARARRAGADPEEAPEEGRPLAWRLVHRRPR